LITFADTETIEVEARLDITRGNMMVDGGISVVLKKPLLSGGKITVRLENRPSPKRTAGHAANTPAYCDAAGCRVDSTLQVQRGIELLDKSKIAGRGTVEIRSVAPVAPAALQGSCEDAVTLLLAQNASLSGDLALFGGASLLLDPPEQADGPRELTLSGGGHTLVLHGASATLRRVEWAGADASPGAADVVLRELSVASRGGRVRLWGVLARALALSSEAGGRLLLARTRGAEAGAAGLNVYNLGRGSTASLEEVTAPTAGRGQRRPVSSPRGRQRTHRPLPPLRVRWGRHASAGAVTRPLGPLRVRWGRYA